MLPLHWRRLPALAGAAFVLAAALPAADLPGGRPGQTPAGQQAGTVLPTPAAIAQDLRSLGTTGTVLHIGAHPDDENTELITWLSLGRGYRAAYLSLTRGDGGQNELGKELDEKLGVARTQELLAARRLDHGRQFFTRAIDFGFSKSPEETLRFWDRDAVLGDVVRIIRQFRPDVIVTRFPVPPGSGGHGHHTASAILAVEAFKLAGDPAAYPEQLRQGLTVWQPKRVLWNSFRGNAALNGPVFSEDIAGSDPVSGETFGAIAGRSRSMHKTQGLGGFAGRANTGPNVQNFMLLAGEPANSDLMDGVDTTWARLPGGAEIDQLAAAALAAFKAEDPAASVPALLALRTKLAALPDDPLVSDKRAQLDRIIQSCLGLRITWDTEAAEVVPGEKLSMNFTLDVAPTGLPVFYVGWRATGADDFFKGENPLDGKHPLHGHIVATVPPNQPLTQPYWLQEPSAVGIAQVSDPTLIGLPENPPALTVIHVLRVGDQQLEIADEPVFVSRDAQGVEHRRRLDVIPPVSLAFNSGVYVVSPGKAKPVTIEVTAARANTRGTLRLEVPAGWSVSPATQGFTLAAVGEKTLLTFKVTAAAAPGAGRFTASAEVGGQSYSNQRQEINYAHLPLMLLQPPARARAVSFELTARGLNVGYLPGSGDSVDTCMEQMGYFVRRLTGADLTPEKLAGLDAVVLGVRAFNERDDLKDAFPGLLAWVEAGGTVIAQYNRPDRLKTTQLGPYPLSIQGPAPQWRVTDETAPVTITAPDSAAVNAPNKIGAADFSGWVQERGAYFPSSWDKDHYTTVLAMGDPGEAPLEGGILVAKYGKGHYVYTGLGFFRQLPAGVPGAYRLFANLLSLGK